MAGVHMHLHWRLAPLGPGARIARRSPWGEKDGESVRDEREVQHAHLITAVTGVGAD